MSPNRLTLVVAVCLGLALVPTVLHSYVGLKTTDGYAAAAAAPQLADLPSQPTERRTAWVRDRFASEDWIERRYQTTEGRDLLLFVARSYDLKRLYHHPELAIAYGSDLRPAGTSYSALMKNVPVHVLRDESGQNAGLAVYALRYDDEFVDDPYVLQVRVAWQLLFTPRRPMTIFFVYDPAAPPGIRLENAPALTLLRASIESFLSQTDRSRSD